LTVIFVLLKNAYYRRDTDDQAYDLDKLSDDAKNQLVSLQYVDQELQQLNAQAAVLQTARLAYANALKEALPKEKKKKGLTFN
jgi:hypothetical protein